MKLDFISRWLLFLFKIFIWWRIIHIIIIITSTQISTNENDAQRSFGKNLPRNWIRSRKLCVNRNIIHGHDTVTRNIFESHRCEYLAETKQIVRFIDSLDFAEIPCCFRCCWLIKRTARRSGLSHENGYAGRNPRQWSMRQDEGPNMYCLVPHKRI